MTVDPCIYLRGCVFDPPGCRERCSDGRERLTPEESRAALHRRTRKEYGPGRDPWQGIWHPMEKTPKNGAMERLRGAVPASPNAARAAAGLDLVPGPCPREEQGFAPAWNTRGDRRPMEEAPKDGTEILLPLLGTVHAYWDEELKRWVLCWPLHIESLIDPPWWTVPGSKDAREVRA